MFHQVQLSTFMIDFELEMMDATLNNIWHECPKKYQFPVVTTMNRVNQTKKKPIRKDECSIQSKENSSKFSLSQRSSLSPMCKKSNFYHSQRNLQLKFSYLNINEQKQEPTVIQAKKGNKQSQGERNQDTPSIKLNVRYSYDGIF